MFSQPSAIKSQAPVLQVSENTHNAIRISLAATILGALAQRVHYQIMLTGMWQHLNIMAATIINTNQVSMILLLLP